MLVVADTSPFIGLLKIGQVELLPKLFGHVVIPTEVAAELSSPRRPPPIAEFITSPPVWISIRAPNQLEEIAGIHTGEQAAISLAVELGADLLLIDDNKGREAAIARNIPTVRTVAVLFHAANAGFLTDLEAAFNKLRATNFRVPGKVLDGLLREHRRLKHP